MRRNYYRRKTFDNKFWLRTGLTLFMAVCLFLVMLSTAIRLGVSDEGYYDSAFKALDSREKVRLSVEDFEAVKVTIMDYVELKSDKLSVMVTLDGQKVDFFNDKEKAHMVDVAALFKLNRNVQWACLLILVVLFFLNAARWQSHRLVRDVLLLGGITVIVFLMWLLWLSRHDFTDAFIRFHEIFFTNQLWLLNPDTDRMIVLLEEAFFSGMAIRMGLYTLALGLLSMIFGGVLHWRTIKK